ncbi:MAG: RecX family transcriptional regulator [Abitibacteriaceae bacterium]|nr:RecX family transcriptional regulator [Abditibacteriaceae bacterium]
MARNPFPGIITSIEEQPKVRRHLGQRVNVFVQGKFSFALDAELVERRGLRAGFLVTPNVLEELLHEDGDARAYARALHYLSYGPRSAAQVQQRLARDEWPPEVVARAVQRLTGEGLLNDAEFAARYVENRSLSRQRGARALRQELRIKGVARDEIEAALPDAEQEIDNAVAAVQSKLRLWSGLEERERQNKIIQFLQRRGFNYGTARAALNRLAEPS